MGNREPDPQVVIVARSLRRAYEVAEDHGIAYYRVLWVSRSGQIERHADAPLIVDRTWTGTPGSTDLLAEEIGWRLSLVGLGRRISSALD
jgi:hypothetical protein